MLRQDDTPNDDNHLPPKLSHKNVTVSYDLNTTEDFHTMYNNPSPKERQREQFTSKVKIHPLRTMNKVR